ncbi:Glycosyltransferase involved in cell wall bisynthesis [Cnuella takakiae]|uniref:Glycosyltransferase involved in cell wall bisynthesis n=1 Tax=Cnuella takakiae TaxID=1302690 RepID=A0A1M5AGV7_9BACT|nr:glycosyltransferase family 2 protein [Cnuella takakiae]OLY91965.1 capsule biosynthesis protein CapI [Cnuella takakiae]SHF29508.1 Glycosyltransferase involved in cell wall bisynthesis [Cnuella takakiae]
MAPLVSIIVNCYNQGKYLERCVNSVLAQTFTDIECLIVDDGSTDNTKEVAIQLERKDNRVQYLAKANGGLPQARNFGVRAAKGTWIQCLDADDWIHPEKTAVQLQAVAEAATEPVVLYCDYERVSMDANDQPIARETKIIGAHTPAQLLQRLMLPDFLAQTPHPSLQQCMLMHRDIFKKHQFPEQLKALGDRFFAVELVASKVPFVYTPFLGTYYSRHQTNRTNSWRYMRNFYLLFYETVNSQYPQLLAYGQVGIEFLLEDALKMKDQQSFKRLLKLVQFPVMVLDKKVKAENRQVLQLLYRLRQWTPGMIWYPQFRKPSVKRFISLLRRPKNNGENKR